MKKRKVFYLKLLPRIPQRSALPEGGEEKEEEDEEEEVPDDVAVGLAWLGKIVYLEQHISSHSSSPGRRRSVGRRGERTAEGHGIINQDFLLLLLRSSFFPPRPTDRPTEQGPRWAGIRVCRSSHRSSILISQNG